MSRITEEYVTTVNKLFKAVKNVTRHGNSLSNLEIFEQRCVFFRNLWAENRKTKFIHVAGSKGKGSTCEYIASALRNCDQQTVGVFTSPHLHTARERIKLNTQLISQEDIVRLGNEALSSMQSYSWTVFFDLFLYSALRYFKEQNCDYVVLEAGIGGRYDSTNFLNISDATVITSISLDHQALLGETVEEIAWQKAGIIKPNCHVFVPANQQQSILNVFRNECSIRNAILHEVSMDLDRSTALCETQAQNASLAAAVVQHLGVPFVGAPDFYWPCRQEILSLPHLRHASVVLDGCHNEDSLKRFLSHLTQVATQDGDNILIIFGAGIEKNLDAMLRQLLCACGQLSSINQTPVTRNVQITFTESRHFRSASEKQLLVRADAVLASLRAQSQQAGEDRGAADSVALRGEEAMDKTEGGTVAARLTGAILEAHGNEERCLRNTNSSAANHGHHGGRQSPRTVIAVCGSLFVAAEAREELFRRFPQLFGENDWVRETDPPLSM